MPTHRERLLKAFNFGNPDKLPLIYQRSSGGLYVHGQKLLDLLNKYPSDNLVSFDKIPRPSPEDFDISGNYHKFVTDDWGTEWEYRLFGLQGHPHRYPLKNWDNLHDYKFPMPLPPDNNYIEKYKKEFMIEAPMFISIFEKLHALRPFEDVLMDLCTFDDNIIKLSDRLIQWYWNAIQTYLDAGCDIFKFGDDWGTQNSLFFPPDFFRKFFKPRLAKLMKPIRDSGRLIIYHSCGAIEPLFDDLVEVGINGLWHQISLYESEKFAKKAAASNVLLYLHMDRQKLIPYGSPAQIRETVRRYAQIHKELGGGAAFYVEVENDAPFKNVKTLIESIHEYR